MLVFGTIALEEGLHLGDGPWFRRVRDQLPMQLEDVDAGARRGRPPVRDAARRAGRIERRDVLRGHEVQGRAHQRALHDRAVAEGRLERGDGERLRPRPQRDIRRVRVLGLEPGEPSDGLLGAPWRALEQRLPEQGRPVQLSQGQARPRGRCRS